jgi:hypothetical protein
MININLNHQIPNFQALYLDAEFHFNECNQIQLKY